MEVVNPNKEVTEDVEFILIGAGLPRTGTLSTWAALERILPGKCHHMLRGVTGPSDPAFWTRAARGDLGDEDWRGSSSDRSDSQPVWITQCPCTGGTWPPSTPGPRCC